MLRILGKDLRISKSTTMVTRSEAEIEAHDVFDDLSSWEFVNPSDDEQEDSYSFSDHTDDDDDDENDELMLKEDDPCEIGSPSSDISMESATPVQTIGTIGALVVSHVEFDHHGSSFHDGDDQDEEEDEDEDYDDDLDDELVPNWLSDKFGRQRIRKLGKRACSKMNKSKKGPYIFNRPGCVRGKHGFGMQHSYV